MGNDPTTPDDPLADDVDSLGASRPAVDDPAAERGEQSPDAAAASGYHDSARAASPEPCSAVEDSGSRHRDPDTGRSAGAGRRAPERQCAPRRYRSGFPSAVNAVDDDHHHDTRSGWVASSALSVGSGAESELLALRGVGDGCARSAAREGDGALQKIADRVELGQESVVAGIRLHDLQTADAVAELLGEFHL